MGYNLTIVLINRTKQFLTPIKESIYEGASILTGSEMLAPNRINHYLYQYSKHSGFNIRLTYNNTIKNKKRDFILFFTYSFKFGACNGFISSSFNATIDILFDNINKSIVVTLTDNK